MSNTTTENTLDDLATPEDGPNIPALITEFTRCAPFSGSNWNAVSANDEVRFCFWANQQPDGKKKSTPQAEAFPFAGASDSKQPLADSIINDIVAECWVAFFRANTGGTKSGLSEESNYAVKLVDWLVNTLLTVELYREVEFAAQYREQYGWFALRACWEREIAFDNKAVKMEKIVQASVQVQAQLQQAVQTLGSDPLAQAKVEQLAVLANLPQLIQNPAYDEQTAEVMQQMVNQYRQGQLEGAPKLPDVTLARCRAVVKSLRETGAALLPVPYYCKDQPAIYALKPWVEVFVSPGTTEARKSRVVFERLWFGVADLRALVLTDGWNSTWVEAAIKKKGQASTWAVGSSAPGAPSTDINAALGAGPVNYTQLDMKHDQVEVICATYRAVDGDGVVGIYETFFNPAIGRAGDPQMGGPGTYAKHSLLSTGGADLPYVTGQRENWSRAISSSRGVPEIVNTWQQEVKRQHDGLADWTALGVMPPINVYENAAGTRYRFGPGVRNTVKLGKEPRVMEWPERGTPVSFELLERISQDVDRYFGRINPHLPPESWASKKEKSVSFFLLTWTEALHETVKLCWRYMDDAQFADVTGAPPGWLDANREAPRTIQARLDFDVRELSPEYVQNVLKAVNESILPQDVQGLTDRSKWTRTQWRMLSPRLSRELVTEQQPASEAIYNQVKADIGFMALGQEAKYVEMDPTAKSKLGFATQIVQANPNYQQLLQNPQNRFAQLMQKYAANLQFSLTQEQNKQVGAIGVKPEAQGQMSG